MGGWRSDGGALSPGETQMAWARGGVVRAGWRQRGEGCQWAGRRDEGLGGTVPSTGMTRSSRPGWVHREHRGAAGARRWLQ